MLCRRLFQVGEFLLCYHNEPGGHCFTVDKTCRLGNEALLRPIPCLQDGLLHGGGLKRSFTWDDHAGNRKKRRRSPLNGESDPWSFWGRTEY